MISYVTKFNLKKQKKTGNDDFIAVNKSSFIKITEYNENNFYFDFMGCMFCKEEYKSFESLFLHMRISHSNYDCYQLVIYIYIN